MKKDYSVSPIKVFVSYIAGRKKLFLIDMGCACLAAMVDLIYPFVSRQALNNLLPQELYTAFFAVMAVLIIAQLSKAGLYYLITVVGHRMGVLVESDMRRDLFDHIQELSCSFYDKNRTGVLMSRITSDLFDVTEFSHHGPESLLICTLTALGALTIMISIQWKLGLTLAVVLSLCLWFSVSQRVKMKRANIEVKRKTADIYAAIESSISGIRTAKAFANEDAEHDKFEHANALFRGAKVHFYRTMGLFTSGMEFTIGAAQIVVITLGGFLIMKGEMNYIDLVTFTLYVTAFTTPLKELTRFVETYMQGITGMERFLEIMRTESAIKDAPDAIELEYVSGLVEYNNVSFDYGNGVDVLKDVSISIQPGKTLAVVGPSGGGKTTLCQLLPRFYDVCQGNVSVDGKDVRLITQHSLRKNIGMIQQDVFIFAGTIRDNIRYGRPDAREEEIVEAAIKAQVHQEIMALPDGYDTFVGERGVMLSGGQKQRISIARVFLKNPKILVMDEATSALDTVTEQRIQEALDSLSKGRTTIIIAHRLSTVRNADTIAVIDGEHIRETGTHDELIAKGGLYSELCLAQNIK